MSSPLWSDDYIPWREENIHIQRTLKRDEHGYELLQGEGIITGHLLGGCLDAFVMYIGTEIWPAIVEVISKEEHLTYLPILYNVNFGHAIPIGIIPYGIMTELNCEEKTITLLESATE